RMERPVGVEHHGGVQIECIGKGVVDRQCTEQEVVVSYIDDRLLNFVKVRKLTFKSGFANVAGPTCTQGQVSLCNACKQLHVIAPPIDLPQARGDELLPIVRHLGRYLDARSNASIITDSDRI